MSTLDAADLRKGDAVRVRGARTGLVFRATYLHKEEGKVGVHWVTVDDASHPLNGRDITVNPSQFMEAVKP